MSRHLHPQHGQKVQRGGVRHLGTINGKNGTLKGWQDKNRGISNNNVNASHAQISTRRLVRGRSERKGLNCCQVHLTPDSNCSFGHFSDVFCSFWQFRVQTVATTMNATEGVQTTPHRTHTRALFPRCARSHARCDHTFGSRA